LPSLQDLSAEATRARRDRQSILTPPTSGSELPESVNTNTRMALRTRKPAKPIVETVEEDDDKKPAPKANRRKTVAGAAAVLGDRVRLTFLIVSTPAGQSLSQGFNPPLSCFLESTRSFN
jgi:hypothetical protein